MICALTSCRAEFAYDPERPSRRFCKSMCRRQYYHANERVGPFKPRKCTVCGNQFTPKVANAVTCSPECGVERKIQRNRNRLKGQPLQPETKKLKVRKLAYAERCKLLVIGTPKKAEDSRHRKDDCLNYYHCVTYASACEWLGMDCRGCANYKPRTNRSELDHAIENYRGSNVLAKAQDDAPNLGGTGDLQHGVNRAFKKLGWNKKGRESFGRLIPNTFIEAKR